jgi:hypothetical protein
MKSKKQNPKDLLKSFKVNIESKVPIPSYRAETEVISDPVYIALMTMRTGQSFEFPTAGEGRVNMFRYHIMKRDKKKAFALRKLGNGLSRVWKIKARLGGPKKKT